MPPLIRPFTPADLPAVLEVINDAAEAYRNVIVPECWHDPYMSLAELNREISGGVEFWCAEEDGRIAGVMGIQDVADVTLIRHAYVRTASRRRGVGGALLAHLKTRLRRPALVGTWAAATWAIRFYERHGFRLLAPGRHGVILRRYWKLADQHTDTSVALGDADWFAATGEEQPDYLDYFAYGSNMDEGRMRRRCPGAVFVVRARLPGHRFRIGSAGYATVVPDPSGVVHGVAWKIAPAHRKALGRYEGAEEGLYRAEGVRIVTPAGDAITALTYVAADSTPGTPHPGYLGGVVAAARAARLPEDYLSELEAWRKA